MKTRNTNVDVYKSLAQAEKAFNKSIVPCAILKAFGSYYIDRGTGENSAINAWPKHYVLIKQK